MRTHLIKYGDLRSVLKGERGRAWCGMQIRPHQKRTSIPDNSDCGKCREAFAAEAKRVLERDERKRPTR